MPPPLPDYWRAELERLRDERDALRASLDELTQLMARSNEQLEQIGAMVRRLQAQLRTLERENRKLRRELGLDDDDDDPPPDAADAPEPGGPPQDDPPLLADPNVCAPDPGTKSCATGGVEAGEACAVAVEFCRVRRRGGGGRRPPPGHLPTVTEHHEVCTCSACGQRTLKRDVLVTRVYSVVTTYLRRRVIRRERTVCSNPDCGRPTTAPMPPMPCSRALYDCGFLAWLMVQTFVLLLPLDRTRLALASQGVNLAMGTLVHLVDLAARLLAPIDGEHMKQLRAGAYFCFDATGLKVLIPGQPEAWDGYFEVFTCDVLSVFQFAMTKHADGLAARLRGFEGTVVCDAESRNKAGADGLRLAFCNAHVVRALDKAAAAQPVLAKVGRGFLEELYAIEERAAAARLAPDDRAAYRARHAVPVLDRFRVWLTEVVEGDLPPSDPVRKIAAYYLRHWEGLTRYVHSGELPIDNNAAEREFQRHAKLRYARLFAGSPEGAHRWATIFGVVRTAQKCGLDVQAYLTWAFERRGTHRKHFGLTAAQLTPMAYRDQIAAQECAGVS